MPRDAAGNYTLPSGNPVVTGTVITSTWANPTMADLGNEITKSLSRDGQGGMRAPLLFFDGTKNDPSITFANEPTLGAYRAMTGVYAITGQGNDIATFSAATGAITNPRTNGQFKVTAPVPVAVNDLTRKDYVDAKVVAGITKPVGAIEIGWNPNGVLPGVWEQWPEGTFIMNTVAGADLAGGSNDAVVISHNHSVTPAGSHTHSRGSMEITGNLRIRDDVGRTSYHTGDGAYAAIESGQSSGYGGLGGYGPRGLSFFASRTWSGVTSNPGDHVHTVSTEGVAGTNLNRPLFKGVAIWERIS